VNAIFEIALDRLDHRHPVSQDQIHNVGAALRVEPHSVPDYQLGAAYPQGRKPWFVVDC
jgi:hypothetical protein